MAILGDAPRRFAQRAIQTCVSIADGLPAVFLPAGPFHLKANPPPATVMDRTLLQAAAAAIARDDLHRADALYLEHLNRFRADPDALAAYGNFCLRTGRPEEAGYLLDKAARLGAGDANLYAELGHARLEADDSEAALRAFEAALARDAGHAIANYGAAQCLQKAGRWSEAAAAFERALSAQPDNVPVLVELANTCQQLGDAARASRLFAHAERLAPGEPAVQLEYGRFLRRSGALPQALQRLQACVRAAPDEPSVLLESARCLCASGDTATALRTLDRLDAIAPRMPEQHEARGECLAAAGDAQGHQLHWEVAIRLWLQARQFDHAQPLIERMLAAYPDSSAAWNSKGSFHDLQQQPEPAEAAYLRAIACDPRSLPPCVNLGTLYETVNRLDEARAMAERGLALLPDDAQAQPEAATSLHLLCAKLARRAKRYADALVHLDATVEAPKSDIEAQTTLFERAKVLDLQGDTDGAVATFNRANAIAVLDPGVDDPDGNKFVRGVDYLLERVDRGWLRNWHVPPDEGTGPDPVFLLGFPRSGTTLLNTVLFSHSAIEVIEEKQTAAKMLGIARRMPGGYPHVLPVCDATDTAILREAYWRATREFCTLAPGQLLVDKFPFYMTLAGLIHVAFPRAKFLFALRHPCDAVLSCFMQNFRLNEAMANFRTIGETAMVYAKTMQLWTAFREQLGLQVHTIRYEGMVGDFEGEVRALCGFLGLPWEEGLRQFATRALDRGKINTPSYEQVSKPIYTDARDRWQRYRRHLEPHLHLLRPWIARFGYPDPDAA